MATRSQRRARQRERLAAKSARAIGRERALKRVAISEQVKANRPPTSEELLELRAWRGVTDSTTHITHSGVIRGMGNGKGEAKHSERYLRELRAKEIS